jgi:glutathione S-transferase
MSTTTCSVDAIVQKITIKAPAARVFEALTDPTQRMKWWGQEGRFESTNAESDLRLGGRWLMSGMGMGRPFRVEGVYRIIERPSVLAFTWLPSWDEQATETLVRFDLHERNGFTTVRLTHSGFATEGSRARHQGWPQILSWLKAYVED